MSDHPVSIQCINKDQLGLALNFRWRIDRFEHEIYLVSGDKKFALLTSIESKSDESWPDSPPLQQISKEEIAGQVAVMGVGMSGSGHWSGSFLLKADPIPRLICELACLTKEAPGQIGSKYLISPEFSMVETSERSQYWQFHNEYFPGGSPALFSAEYQTRHSSQIDLRTSQLLIQPTRDAQQSKNTIQWNYRIFLTEKSGV